MARKRRNRPEERDHSQIANFVAPRPILSRPSSSVTFVTRPRVALTEIEDRRSYHPLGFFRPARSFDHSQHTLTVKQPAKNKPRYNYRSPFAVPSAVQFKGPKKVLVCVRRQQRKEVIHALGKTGKGARAPRRRSYYSGVHCK